MRVLFYSTAIVSPTTGAGQTVYNLLEPSQSGQVVYYASPDYQDGRFEWATLYDEIQGRMSFLSMEYPSSGLMQSLRRIMHSLPVVFGALHSKVHNASIEGYLAAQIQGLIRKLDVDVLLVYLASKRDIKVAYRLLANCPVPIAIWIMDDHKYDKHVVAQLQELWKRASVRLVISEAMQEHYSALFGSRESHVFNNSHAFDEPIPENNPVVGRPLRIGYAGSTAGYYKQALEYVFNELRGLHGQFELDIYSHYRKHRPVIEDTEIPCQMLEYLPPDELLEHLKEYDILLLLSSFEDEYRALTEYSLASKLADYLCAGRCILVMGPSYAENVRYAKKYDFAEVLTSMRPGELRAHLFRLKEHPELRNKRSHDAYLFGQKMHNATINSARMWKLLSRTH